MAADEAALRWLDPREQDEYGPALIQALRHAHTFPTPYGALPLGESIRNLKQRIVMLSHHASLARGRALAAVLSLVLASLAFLHPATAAASDDAKKAATAAMDAWLSGIDAGNYEASWKAAGAEFQQAITSAKWQEALTQVRTPLGKVKARKLASALYQTSVPQPNGEPLKGEFVIAQFNSAYENLASALDTVVFAKQADGSWKATGYFIKPN